MAVTYRSRKRAVPYKTRLTGRLTLIQDTTSTKELARTRRLLRQFGGWALVPAAAGGGIGRLGDHEHHQAQTEIEERQQIKRIAEAHDDRLAMHELL